MRSAVAGVLTSESAQAIQRPFLRAYCKSVIGRGDLNDDFDMLRQLYLYMIDNGLRIQGRGTSFGTPTAAAANVGTTQIIRLTRDKYNFPLEAGYIEAKKAKCVADSNAGSLIGGGGTERGQELFLFEGQTPAPDDLQRSGSGAQALIAGLSADKSLLTNASFGNYDDATAPTDIPGWSSSAGISSSIMTFDTTYYFRQAPSEATAASIKLLASTTLSQAMSVSGQKLSDDVPYGLFVVWNRAQYSGSGTLTLGLGSGIATPITVSAQTGWVVSLVPSSLGWGSWYRQSSMDAYRMYMNWVRISGSILIDDVILAPGTFFDGNWYWVVPTSTAAYVPSRIRDQYTWADSAIDSIIAKWIWRAWAFTFPSSIGSSISWADPS